MQPLYCDMLPPCMVLHPCCMQAAVPTLQAARAVLCVHVSGLCGRVPGAHEAHALRVAGPGYGWHRARCCLGALAVRVEQMLLALVCVHTCACQSCSWCTTCIHGALPTCMVHYLHAVACANGSLSAQLISAYLFVCALHLCLHAPCACTSKTAIAYAGSMLYDQMPHCGSFHPCGSLPPCGGRVVTENNPRRGYTQRERWREGWRVGRRSSGGMSCT